MEKKNEKPPKTVKIHVFDRDGRFEVDATVPVNTTMRAFIKSMGKKFNLPQEGPIKNGKLRGQYRYYRLINKRTREILRGSERGKTFADYDIRDGDTIKVSEIIPG